MILGNINRQWIFCGACRSWKRSDYYTVLGALNRLCESCVPEPEQPIPDYILARENKRQTHVDNKAEYVIDSIMEGI